MVLRSNKQIQAGSRRLILALLLAGAAQPGAPAAHARALDGDAAAPAIDGAAAAPDSLATTITVLGSRTPLSLLEAPATLNVLDADYINRTLSTDIRDLVRYIPGVSVRRQPARFGAAQGTTGRDGNAGFVIRGIGGNRVLVEVDGIRVPEAFGFGAQQTGRDYVDVGLLRSVEILRGPATLYGSDGLAGVVSFTTLSPADVLGGNDWATRGTAGFDSAENQWTGQAAAAARLGRLSILATGTVRSGHELENRGTNEAPDSTRTAANPQDIRSQAALGKLVYALTDSQQLRLVGEWGEGRTQTEVLSGRAPSPVLPTHVIDLDADDRQERARVSLDWAWDGNERVKGAAIAAYWQQAKNLQQTEEDRLTAADRLRINSFDTTIFGLQANMSFGFEAAGTNSRLIIGGDWYWTQVEGLRDGTVPTPPDVFPTRAFPPTETFNGGFFLGDEISLANGRLLLFPGLRLDVYSLRSLADPANPSGVVPVNLSDSALSPKFGMTFRATPGFSVIATYSQGFKAPAPYEVNNFFDNPTSPFFAYRSLPNPDLRPERSRTIEGGFRVEEGPANAQLTAYVGRYTDFISQEQVSGSGTIRDPLVFQFVNLAEVDISGLEASTNLDLGRGVTLSYAMAWTKGRTRDPLRGDRPLLTIDPIEMVAGLQYEDPEGRFGGEMVTTIAGAKELDETSGNCTPSCLVSRDWLLFDMTAWWAVTPRVMLRLGAFNLTNARYIEWSTIAGLADTPANRAVADAFTSPGRNVRLTISLSFP